MSRFGWRQLLYILPIVGLLLVLTNRQIETTPTPVQEAVDNQMSDYYLREVHISHMGRDGELDDELFSKLLTHYPHDNHADLDAPRFRIHQSNGEKLWAEAKQGVLYDEERLVLTDDVKIEQRSAQQKTTNRIESREVEIERVSQKVTSREQVRITGENYTIVAGAMELLSKESQLFLTHGVEGHYEP
ncbi:MAG: LPS export ABC transporter periplasmic protein LptC [Gammaproteobacteria bacterium]|nr:LPS export ABC transporter periplasmic protein LptC [Gammaproteobacteria bacterium]